MGQVAIDGKGPRGSAGGKLGPLHLVSARATHARLGLAQVAVEGKSNEIAAIPQLLELLGLRGALVTIDAIGCRKAIAKQIVAGGGGHVLVVKGNQERLLEDARQTIARAPDGELPAGAARQSTATSQGHGRQEGRSCVVVGHVAGVRGRRAYGRLAAVGMCRRERACDGTTTTDVCYFIGSRRMGARRYAEALRSHRGIENNLHWQLDVRFREDAGRVENRRGAANFALLREMALGLLKQHPGKDSIARKRKAAALDPGFLAETLAGADKLQEV